MLRTSFVDFTGEKRRFLASTVVCGSPQGRKNFLSIVGRRAKNARKNYARGRKGEGRAKQTSLPSIARLAGKVKGAGRGYSSRKLLLPPSAPREISPQPKFFGTPKIFRRTSPSYLSPHHILHPILHPSIHPPSKRINPQTANNFQHTAPSFSPF